MNVLFLTTNLPSHKLHGSEVASQTIIDALNQAGCDVTVVGYTRKEDNITEFSPQEILVREQYVETKKAKLYPFLWFGQSLIQNLPYSSAKYYSRDYINLVKSLLAQKNYQIVIIDHSQLDWLTNFLPPQTKLIFIAHNIEQEIYRQHCQNSNNFLAKLVYQREADLIRDIEASLTHKVQEIWTLTEHDAKYFAQFNPSAKIRPLPLLSSLDNLNNQSTNKKFEIGLIGSWTWKANQDSLKWFLSKVYPFLPNSISIHIAGRDADWIQEQYPRINYQGFVEDAQQFMAQAKVLAIPTLSGGGIEIKTLDAIASGSQIVATPTATRGISQLPPTVQVAQHPQQFAELLVQAVENQSNANSFELVHQWYSLRREKFLAEVSEAIKQISTNQVNYY
ncbi:putative glycosyl transferase, group 1 [Stanieria sp. NIES-3757]|nr:putative glycosyl transferase, group 1 [Stanieria sp. NIES-3757]